MQNKKAVIEGEKVVGVVKNITTFGAFIDIGMKSDGMLVNLFKKKTTFIFNNNNFFCKISIFQM